MSARTLHRVITIAGFVADPDFPETPGAEPAWQPIVLPPYTDKIAWWVVPYDGADPETDNKVAASGLTFDAELIYGDVIFERGTSSYSSQPCNTRVVETNLPPTGAGYIWVRVSAIAPAGTATHLAVFWAKVR